MTRRKQRKIAAYLDAKLPLAGASHADVERYFTATPMRYTQCFAALTDGRVVRLRDARQFLGWSGDEQERSFLFGCKSCRIVINTVNGGYQVEDPTMTTGVRRFIGRDGSLFFVRRWGRAAEQASSEGLFVNYGLAGFEPAAATI
jgi:hypothetical protein